MSTITKKAPITSTGGDGRTYELRDAQTGEPVRAGCKRDGFRGKYRIDGGRAPQHEGSSGRVWTDQGEFFPTVVNARWVRIN